MVKHPLSNIIASALHLLYSDVISQLFGHGKYNRPSASIITHHQSHDINSGCSTSVVFRLKIPITELTELTSTPGQMARYMCGDHLRARSIPVRAVDVTPSPHAVKNQTERLKWLGGRGFDVARVPTANIINHTYPW